MIALIVIIAMILIVPHVVPYKYSQIITVNGSRDKTAGNMAPFTYSEKELAYMAEGGEVFLTSWERTAWDGIISSV